MRQEFSRKVKAQAFERAKGRCEVCTAKLSTGKFQYDHIVPDAVGGPATLDNCRVACSSCHGAKTATDDVPQIAKTKRVRDKHTGAMKTQRGFRGWRKFDGTVVWRDK